MINLGAAYRNKFYQTKISYDIKVKFAALFVLARVIRIFASS